MKFDNVKIRKITFTSEEMTCEAKAPRKKDYCLMDDVGILPVSMLVALKERIEYGIKKRRELKPSRSEG